jgi:hypothetical protein
MISRRIHAAIAVLALPFTFSAHGAAMSKPDIKLNPQPRMRYEITIKVANAPGPFDRVEGVVDYRVSNDNCVPLTPANGAAVAPEKRVPVVLTHSGGNVYRAEIYAYLRTEHRKTHE